MDLLYMGPTSGFGTAVAYREDSKATAQIEISSFDWLLLAL
jgi:hypothetical protein